MEMAVIPELEETLESWKKKKKKETDEKNELENK